MLEFIQTLFKHSRRLFKAWKITNSKEINIETAESKNAMNKTILVRNEGKEIVDRRRTTTSCRSRSMLTNFVYRNR